MDGTGSNASGDDEIPDFCHRGLIDCACYITSQAIFLSINIHQTVCIALTIVSPRPAVEQVLNFLACAFIAVVALALGVLTFAHLGIRPALLQLVRRVRRIDHIVVKLPNQVFADGDFLLRFTP